MAIKIRWQSPDDNNITLIKIERSLVKYGEYSIVATINATSDGEPKSVNNSWVTYWIDQAGMETHWYRISFFDNVNSLWSETSEPITGQQEIKLCTVDDVKRIIETVGRWNDDEIFDEISKAEDLIYIEMGTPIQGICSNVGKDEYRYYVGEQPVHRIDRVFYGTTTKVELFLDDEYKTNNRYGMIEILPYASSGIEINNKCDIEIHYVPGIFNQLAKYSAARALLEKADMTSGGNASKELEVIEKRIKEINILLNNRFAIQTTQDVKHYNRFYGVNKRYLRQDFDRNKYLGGQNW